MVRQLRILVVLAGGLRRLGPRARRPAFEVDSKARLVDAGQAGDVQVTVTCPAGAEVLEAFLYMSQDGNQSRLTQGECRQVD
jgi:hypothetical protein